MLLLTLWLQYDGSVFLGLQVLSYRVLDISAYVCVCGIDLINMSALMISLKNAEMKAEAIPVHMHHKQTATKQQKYKDETTTVMVHTGQINKTTTLLLLTEE